LNSLEENTYDADMQQIDSYGRKWPVRRVNRRVGRFSVKLDIVQDFDGVLESFANTHPDDTDMIPYFADLWPSAIALGEYLQKRFATLEGVRVMELGCGLGLPSLIAAMLGADVTASDFHPDNLPYLRANIALNQLNTIQPVTLDWRDICAGDQYNLILGSDLLYEEAQVESLVGCIVKILAPNGHLLLADPVRKQLQSAFDSLEKHGIQTQIHVLDEIAILEGVFGE
jgi:predicted nicotinamide N-methyase